MAPQQQSPTLEQDAPKGVWSFVTDNAYLLLCLAVLFWSGNFVIGKAVSGQVPPMGLAFWRWALATLVTSFFCLKYVRRDLPLIKQHFPMIAFLGLIGVAGFNTFIYLGLQTTQAINALLLNSFIPVLIVLLSFLFFKDRLTVKQLAGVLVSTIGVIAIVSKGSWQTLMALSLNPGDLWVLVAVMNWGIYSVFLRKKPQVHPFSFLWVTFLIGTLAVAPLYLHETYIQLRPIPTVWSSLIAIGYVALFPSIASYLCFNRGVQLIGANRAGIFIHLMPVFGTVLAVIFLGEAFQTYHAVGFGLILSGVFVTSRQR